MPKFSVYFVVIAMIVLQCACKKHSHSWLTGEIYVVDAVTGEPVKALLELQYYEGSLFGSEEVIVDLGYTDEYGFYELEENIRSKDKGFMLNVHAAGYYGIPDWFGPDASAEISRATHNEVILEVNPVYLVNFNLNNVSCYDESDSMWLYRSGFSWGVVYPGCLTDSLLDERNFRYWSHSDTMSFRTISKKNEIQETINHHFDLVKGFNTFDLNY